MTDKEGTTMTSGKHTKKIPSQGAIQAGAQKTWVAKQYRQWLGKKPFKAIGEVSFHHSSSSTLAEV